MCTCCRIHKQKAPELYINQFTPSSLHWRAAGLRVLQTVETDSRNNILVVRIQTEGSSEAGKAASAILKIRIPKWAASASFKIDYGTPLTALQTSELPYYWSVGVSPTVGSLSTWS